MYSYPPRWFVLKWTKIRFWPERASVFAGHGSHVTIVTWSGAPASCFVAVSRLRSSGPRAPSTVEDRRADAGSASEAVVIAIASAAHRLVLGRTVRLLRLLATRERRKEHVRRESGGRVSS